MSNMEKKRVLLTGGVGFIGHHTVEHFLKKTSWDIVILDRLSYAGNQNFLTDMEVFQKPEYSKRVSFVFHYFRAPISETTDALLGHIDYCIHMGAESHVDRSIDDPMSFAEANVIGTVNMLNWARGRWEQKTLEKFLYVSTDEVYGPALNGHLHKEGEPHKPSNPYSASKSGAEAFCYAYWNTYGMPILITNTMNNFGERQHPEKFVAKTVKRLLNDEPMIVHCKKVETEEDGEIKHVITEISSRCWLHARNHADGLLFVLENGEYGQSYNITGEWADIEMMVKLIANILGVTPKMVFEDFHSFRPGHDMHYGLDGNKLKEMGWTPPYSLVESLTTTVEWMKSNKKWLGL